jgi:hypothetical protein
MAWLHDGFTTLSVKVIGVYVIGVACLKADFFQSETAFIFVVYFPS